MRFMRALLAAVLTAHVVCATAANAATAAFSFGLFGDMPYFELEEAPTRDILREMARHDLAFVVHDGDIKRGGNACTDALYLKVKRMFDQSAHPLVYLPGDNEWTDCHRAGADPLERLARLRQIFHSGEESLGRRRIALERQSRDVRFRQYRENVRWSHLGVLFVGLNVPGSNNNFGRSESADAEYRARNAANLAWLEQSFKIARDGRHRAVVVLFQANPLFELPRTERGRRGYVELVDLLESETIASWQPVVLVHGDTHFHRIDKPMIDRRTHRTVANFTRVETYGSPMLGWVKCTYDPSRSEPFSFEAFPYRPGTPSGERR